MAAKTGIVVELGRVLLKNARKVADAHGEEVTDEDLADELKRLIRTINRQEVQQNIAIAAKQELTREPKRRGPRIAKA